ncbi:imidazole glycerol phosphate synthase subunit HisF [Rhodophyticola sp. CCM32]|uniref:imidazole glycerol phosphate synthase subunit HisF n=1 Tax=Rhodophyticola sp. CCM32 TaxID=2916397 RepID=UPI00107F877D|nr:imidazole glycerol phosphate synthase cyclase subunit [Rhodophyticola sp. CCM32]QBY01309.1 imidazole glycerol phosphate synthase subunit HisF [Rhodophyticola sp. CCM32]
MRNVRLIARLDIKLNWLIKGVQMEGWRKVGPPAEFARTYAEGGADELFLMDAVASLYERNSLLDIVRTVATEVFVPMTVGGGVRSVEDANVLLSSGADKVAINTAATRDPSLISALSDRFGAQATVVSIEAIRSGTNWLAMTDNGRNHTGRDVLEWASEAEKCGAGEIVLTSIDKDGLGSGFDVDLVRQVSDRVSIPVVASGGLGTGDHLVELIDKTEVSGVAVAQALHWRELDLSDLRQCLRDEGIFVRPLPEERARYSLSS